MLLAAFGSFVQCSFHPNNPQPRGGYLPFEAAGAEITPKGEVSAPYSISLWPQPQQLQAGEGTTALDVNFQFKYVGAMNVSSLVADILEDNFNRYYSILFAAVQPSSMSQREEATKSLSLTVLQLLVNVTSTDDSFGLGTNESYSLSVGEGDSQGHLSCMTVYGCIRGLETFSQLVIHPTDAVSMPFLTGIPFIINDFPRFPHRGLLMDSSRHYLPLASIQRIVDALSYDKANVLHWHMTDAQSFPFASQRVPEMVEGAWGPLAVYTVDDVGAIVQYARYRGVAVVLELDSPSHVQSWGVGRPDIIVNATSNPYWSVLNPAVNATYEVYASLIQELRTVLIDDRFHLGNDEVQFQVYNTSQVNAWMAASGIAAGDYAGVVRHHMQAAQSIVEDAGFEHLLWWQEAFDHYGTGNNTPTPPPAFLTNNSVAYLWYCPCWHWYNMLNVTTMGFRGECHSMKPLPAWPPSCVLRFRVSSWVHCAHHSCGCIHYARHDYWCVHA